MSRKIKVIFAIMFACLLLSGCVNDASKSNKKLDDKELQSETSNGNNDSSLDAQINQSAQEKQSENISNDNNTSTESNKEVLEIKEKMFITQINDIFYNIDDYKDKVIVVEGMYSKWNLWNGNKKVPVVYRNGPGCCGNDGWGGFWLNYDGELPKENDWIRVTGTPEIVTDDYCLYLYLNVTSLEVKTERGAEFVPQ